MSRVFWSTVWKELYQRRWSVISYSIGALLFLVLYVAIYPSFQSESANFDELLRSYPKALLEAFNIDQLQLTTIEGYVSAEHFSFVWPLLAIFFGLATAGAAIAGEVDKGTMSFMLSLPVGRIRLFIAKYFSALVSILFFTVVSITSFIPLVKIMNLSVNGSNVIKTSILSALFMWAIYCMGLLVSSIASEKSTVYFTIGGVLFAMYVVKILSGLINSLDKLKYTSIFYYYSPDKALTNGQLSVNALVVLSAIGVLCTISGLWLFKRRDVNAS
jgi:ABC-2 type transport system permease protein